jgi:RNA polymerase sigma-70 factor (ECF subfamily)
MSTPLVKALLAARACAVPVTDERSVEEALAEAVRAAEEAWPGFRLPREAFVAYLSERLTEPCDDVRRATSARRLRVEDDLAGAIRAIRARDLYLACACAWGEPNAVLAFERACLAEVDDVLARMRIPRAMCDDAKQILRRRLFVGDAGRGPRIVEYAGRGELSRWVRASAVRIALRLVKQAGKGGASVDRSVLEALSDPAQDPELDFLKRSYGGEFEAALRAAFDDLAVRDRNLLRYHFGKGLSIDELGVLYRVHRATAARRLERANTELAQRTRDHLAERLGLSRAEVSSVLRLIRSQIERTLAGLLLPPTRAT